MLTLFILKIQTILKEGEKMGAIVKGGLKIIGAGAANWLGWEAGSRIFGK